MKPPLIATLVFCSLLGMLMLLFCAQPERPKGIVLQHPTGSYNPYNAVNNRFSLNLPAGWAVAEYTGNVMLKATAPAPDSGNNTESYAENIVIETLPLSTVYNYPSSKTDSLPPFNLNALGRWFFDDLQVKTYDYKVIEIGETLINNNHAAQFLYSYNNPQEYNGELKAISYLFIQDHRVVLATCTEFSGTFNKKRKMFEYVVQSMRFPFT
ncbi:hypothetical protein C7N43_38655 [Sphingobacteriales bacterium UPWRP_1]|nr:hypothetical protein B6N25_00150 [Sphingobacteriales bacterium TSM_CSS]PSJ71570.1 hypothetical protein C7N43_38655 [Sphingobacteriales bacterium UPWRP_1]